MSFSLLISLTALAWHFGKFFQKYFTDNLKKLFCTGMVKVSFEMKCGLRERGEVNSESLYIFLVRSLLLLFFLYSREYTLWPQTNFINFVSLRKHTNININTYYSDQFKYNTDPWKYSQVFSLFYSKNVFRICLLNI